MGLSNTIATLPGMFSPIFVGFIVTDHVRFGYHFVFIQSNPDHYFSFVFFSYCCCVSFLNLPYIFTFSSPIYIYSDHLEVLDAEWMAYYFSGNSWNLSCGCFYLLALCKWWNPKLGIIPWTFGYGLIYILIQIFRNFSWHSLIH